jgi:hypothetical protein
VSKFCSGLYLKKLKTAKNTLGVTANTPLNSNQAPFEYKSRVLSLYQLMCEDSAGTRNITVAHRAFNNHVHLLLPFLLGRS